MSKSKKSDLLLNAIERIESLSKEFLDSFKKNNQINNYKIFEVLEKIHKQWSKKIKINSQLDELESIKVTIPLSPTQFESILDNTIFNSIEAEATFWNIQIYVKQKQLVLIISDNGLGFSANQIEIFNNGHNIASTKTNSKISGYNIGLSSIKEWVNKSKGSIEIYKDQYSSSNIKIFWSQNSSDQLF